MTHGWVSIGYPYSGGFLGILNVIIQWPRICSLRFYLVLILVYLDLTIFFYDIVLELGEFGSILIACDR